jgi:hypothetical protein
MPTTTSILISTSLFLGVSLCVATFGLDLSGGFSDGPTRPASTLAIG